MRPLCVACGDLSAARSLAGCFGCEKAALCMIESLAWGDIGQSSPIEMRFFFASGGAPRQQWMRACAKGCFRGLRYTKVLPMWRECDALKVFPHRKEWRRPACAGVPNCRIRWFCCRQALAQRGREVRGRAGRLCFRVPRKGKRKGDFKRHGTRGRCGIGAGGRRCETKEKKERRERT